jgi:chitinase
MIGITPMIGENDDHYKFTTDNAQKVANFAKQKGIGLLAFWGMQRDRSGSGDLDNFSNVSQSNFQFLNIFNQAR